MKFPAGETGRLKVRMTPSLMAAESQKKNKRHIAISGMLALGVHGVRFKRDLVTSLVSQRSVRIRIPMGSGLPPFPP